MQHVMLQGPIHIGLGKVRVRNKRGWKVREPLGKLPHKIKSGKKAMQFRKEPFTRPQYDEGSRSFVLTY